MTTFFLQDPKRDLGIHHKRWSKRLPGAILFRAAFDKPLLSNRLESQEAIPTGRKTDYTATWRVPHWKSVKTRAFSLMAVKDKYSGKTGLNTSPVPH
jgi:hypothetical protein